MIVWFFHAKVGHRQTPYTVTPLSVSPMRGFYFYDAKIAIAKVVKMKTTSNIGAGNEY
jgi:hypothetical protein